MKTITGKSQLAHLTAFSQNTGNEKYLPLKAGPLAEERGPLKICLTIFKTQGATEATAPKGIQYLKKQRRKNCPPSRIDENKEENISHSHLFFITGTMAAKYLASKSISFFCAAPDITPG